MIKNFFVRVPLIRQSSRTILTKTDTMPQPPANKHRFIFVSGHRKTITFNNIPALHFPNARYKFRYTDFFICIRTFQYYICNTRFLFYSFNINHMSAAEYILKIFNTYTASPSGMRRTNAEIVSAQ